MQAIHTTKHGDNGKQSVYAVQLSASPSYIYIVGSEYVTEPYVPKTGTARSSPGLRYAVH